MDKLIKKISGAVIASVLALTLSSKAYADPAESPATELPVPQYEEKVTNPGDSDSTAAEAVSAGREETSKTDTGSKDTVAAGILVPAEANGISENADTLNDKRSDSTSESNTSDSESHSLPGVSGNIEVNDEYVKKGRYHIPKVSGEATRELLSLKERPTVIMYPDDYSLLGGITEIEKHGLKIPEDISIVGYDGIKLSRLLRPIITTYVQNSTEIGIQATKKLISLIEKPKITLPDRTLVSGMLQQGETVRSIK